MSQLFNRATLWMVDRPKLVWVLLGTISIIAIVGYWNPRFLVEAWDANEGRRLPASSANTTQSPAAPDVDPFSLDADAVLVVQSEEFFSPAGATALRDIVSALEEADYVRNVLWMDRVPIMNIFGLPEPLFPRSEASAERFANAREKALGNPLVKGQLLSADAKTLLMMVPFDYLFIESDQACVAGLREIFERTAARHPDVELSLEITGRVPIYLDIMKTRDENVVRYQLIGYGMVLVMSVILFRGIWAVIVVAIAPSLGVFWTLGILRFLELQDNPFNDVVLPVLLSMVGLTDGVHLMVQIRRFRAEGMSPKEAAREGIRHVGLACFLTSLTTAIGFGSLLLADHEIVEEFGLSCTIGVLLTFIAVVTSIPLACNTWLGKWIHKGHSKGIIDQHFGRISLVIDYVLRHTKLFCGLGIGLTCLFLAVSLTLRPDERLANLLNSHSEPALALRTMDVAMGGLERSSVRIFWNDEVAADSPEILTVLGEVHRILDAESLIGHPLSVHSLLASLPGDGRTEDRMSMLELLPPPLKRAFFRPENRDAEVMFRVQDLGIARYGPVFERIETKLAAVSQAHPHFSVWLEGTAVNRWKNVYQIVVDLATSLGTASVIIFGVLAVVYRSLRIGLISILPNIFPLTVAGAFLAVTGQALELVSVCAFTVCLGIAVDDTIHFLTRFEEERQRHTDQSRAIREAFTGVGTALIMTTVVLVCGFGTVMFSDARDHKIFATMGAITIGSALFGDLVFLPAMLARFAGSKRSQQ